MITLERSKNHWFSLNFCIFHSELRSIVYNSQFLLTENALYQAMSSGSSSAQEFQKKSWKRDSQNFGIWNFEADKNFAILSDLKEVTFKYIHRVLYTSTSTLFRFCANQIAVEVVKNFKILSFEIIELKDKYKTASNNYFV